MTKEIEEQPTLIFPFLLRLDGHMLTLVLDSLFMGRAVSHLRRRMKKEYPKGIIHRPVERGVAHTVAERAIDSWFDNIHSFGVEDQNTGYYDALNLLDTITDVYILSDNRTKRLDALDNEIQDLLYKSSKIKDADDWCDLAMGEGIDLVHEFVSAYRKSKAYRQMRDIYIAALADRILHDRQLCSYLAGQMLTLAPRSRKKGVFERKRIVNRVNWPAFVKKIVVARDRGKCSYCKIDMTLEMLENPHLDHIYPISKGGCNDIVNLQLCCEKCNRNKGTRQLATSPSIPEYFGNKYYFDIDDGW